MKVWAHAEYGPSGLCENALSWAGHVDSLDVANVLKGNVFQRACPRTGRTIKVVEVRSELL